MESLAGVGLIQNIDVPAHVVRDVVDRLAGVYAVFTPDAFAQVNHHRPAMILARLLACQFSGVGCDLPRGDRERNRGREPGCGEKAHELASADVNHPSLSGFTFML
jgi:hypothetical protein